MLCPIRDKECVYEKCAWWLDGEFDLACALWIIAKNLDVTLNDIEVNLYNIANKGR